MSRMAEFLVEVQHFFSDCGDSSGKLTLEQFKPWLAQLRTSVPRIRAPPEQDLLKIFHTSDGLSYLEFAQRVFSMCADTAQAEEFCGPSAWTGKK